MAVGITRGKRRLARHINPIVTRSGLTPQQLMVAVGASRQTIGRILKGESLPIWATYFTLLTTCGATADEIAKARELHGVADVATTDIKHWKYLPEKYQVFRLYEREAVSVRTLDQTVIPGLLQTAAYAEDAARRAWRTLGTRWDEQAAEERQERQALLSRDPGPLELHALIDEGALHRVSGGPEIMRAQLDHLLTASKLPNVVIQVIPYKIGNYGAYISPITLMTFPEEDEPDAAFVESYIGLDGIEDPDSVDVLSAVWGDVAASALTPKESTAFIRRTKDR